MITTADWLRYIDSLGPTDPESLRLRLESAGAEPRHAAWLASIARQRQIAHVVGTVGFLLLVGGIGWAAFQWWRAVNGVAPSDMLIAAGVIAVGVLTTIVGSATEISAPLDLASHKSIPSELPAPPRQIRAAYGTAARRLVLAVAAVMLVPLVLTIPRARNRLLLRDHGVETTGRIVNTFVRRQSRGGRRYTIAYVFDRGSGQQTVPRRDFAKISVGDPVPVTYLPSDPTINFPVRRSELISRFGVFGDPPASILVAYFGILLPLMALVLRLNVNPRALGERGAAELAEVTRVRPQAIEYRYGNRTGRYFFGKRRLRERPAEGQPLVVLYDPERPTRSIPLGALSDYEIN